jgi:hypothetical protein
MQAGAIDAALKRPGPAATNGAVDHANEERLRGCPDAKAGAAGGVDASTRAGAELETMGRSWASYDPDSRHQRGAEKEHGFRYDPWDAQKVQGCAIPGTIGGSDGHARTDERGPRPQPKFTGGPFSPRMREVLV